MEVRFADRLLPLTDATVRRRGAVSGEVKRQTGQSPSVIDTLLALVTRNLRDVRHSGATLFNPWEASPERQTPNRNQRR
jgi:hypothetical protein